MEFLPEHPTFEFHPNTLYDVRKAHGLEKPGRMLEAVKILDEWVKKQPHFKKHDFHPHYLETGIISAKGSLEKAKRQMDKVCTLKTLMPDFFNKTDIANDFTSLSEFVRGTYLPKLTSDNYRVVLNVVTDKPFTSAVFPDYYRFAVINNEQARRHDYSNGFVFITDLRKVNLMDLITKINPMEMKNAMTLYTEGYGLRIKGIHVITESPLIDTLLSALKTILTPKLSQRLHVHKKLDTLYDHIPRDLLPLEYGGKEKSYIELHDKLVKTLSSQESVEYLKTALKAGTDEKYRPTDIFNEHYIGMPGTFRTLNVD